MSKTTARDNTAPPGRELATLAGGCFWCLEAVFDHTIGIDAVESGYMGGHVPNVSYEEICGGDTGHAEVVRITFDPAILRYDDLLDIFFAIHDPTTLNRQGNDVGTQYRSAIFYHSAEQKRLAEAKIAALTAAREFSAPIVTEVTAAAVFYEAEVEHQEYYDRIGERNPYCAYVVAPKVAKFRKQFAQRVR